MILTGLLSAKIELSKSAKIGSLLMFFQILIISAMTAWAALPAPKVLERFRVQASATRLIALDNGMSAFQLDFRLTSSAAQTLFLPTIGEIASASLNGRRVDSNAMSYANGVDAHKRILILPLPSQGLVAGHNRLTVVVAESAGDLAKARVYLGATSQIHQTAQSFAKASVVFSSLMPISLIFIAIFLLAVIFLAPRPKLYLFLLGAVLFQSIIQFQTILFDSQESFTLALPFLSVTSQYLTFLTFFYWITLPVVSLRWANGIYGFAILFYVAAAVAFPTFPTEARFYSESLYLSYNVIGHGYVAYAILKLARTGSRNAAYCSAIILALTVAQVVRIVVVGQVDTVYLIAFFESFSRTALALGIVMLVLGALYGEATMYREARLHHGELVKLVSGHHLTLDRQSQALRQEIAKNAVHEERERSVRDMHDGIGGQLLTLLLKTRSGDDANPALATDVQSIIQELRLITSALDEADDSLTDALERLKKLLEVQARAAQIALVWQMPERFEAALDPRQTMAVMRMLQEAVANAVRHAQAHTITVRISEGNGLRFVVLDDGTGCDPGGAVGGNGLRNMRTRIERMGGSVRFGAGDDGTGFCVIADVPVAPATSAALAGRN